MKSESLKSWKRRSLKYFCVTKRVFYGFFLKKGVFHISGPFCQAICLLKKIQIFNPFSINVPLYITIKRSENLRFSDVFQGFWSGTLVENGLTKLLYLFLNFRSLITSEVPTCYNSDTAWKCPYLELFWSVSSCIRTRIP